MDETPPQRQAESPTEQPMEHSAGQSNERTKSRSGSVVETTEKDVAGSTLTGPQWQAMIDTVSVVYNTRIGKDNYDPSKVFHRKVNKRTLPDYYEVIKEPMALSTLKQKTNTKQYKNFSEFVRDCTLIVHNAQTYNRPEAMAYQDALIIKGVFEREFQNLVDHGIITAEAAVLPDLGEIPPASPLPLLGEHEEEDEEDDEEDDDEEEGEDSDEDGPKRKRKRGPRSTAAITKREGKEDNQKIDAESRIKRGRPPRIDTPLEARIKNIYKGLRKVKTGKGGELKVRHFEKVPEKATNQEYYTVIKNPIALDIIKRKTKRKKYDSVDAFMKDVELMFENAKMYNEEYSEIYKDAVDLQMEGRKLAEVEKRKPDTEFVDEDGRFPLPDGIFNNGKLWKVGDWVHIENGNDPSKPIVAQIYRTWQDTEQRKWVNACWYYRPEQTVHHVDKHFFPNEVVKTGQYRDHPIDEVVDHCFVMFVTRYFKGRPRGLDPTKEVYVCEARYNEENKKINKIKTWSSCLPDEVREQDYEMDLFDVPKKMKKIPSPIKHLLAESAKETDDLPTEQWGVENAPPRIGAVHRRPREENESPPPEPTPSPPPQLPAQPPPQSIRRPSNIPEHNMDGHRAMNAHQDAPASNVPIQAQRPSMSPAQNMSARASTPNYQYPARQYHQQSASPAPTYNQNYTNHTANYPPQTPRTNFAQIQTGSHVNHHPTSQSSTTYHQNNTSRSGSVFPNPSTSYNAPRPAEVYTLSDAANAAIPPEIRNQFHCDNNGHIVFFTKPPLVTHAPDGTPYNYNEMPETSENITQNGVKIPDIDISNPSITINGAVAHSARYLAAKAKRSEAIKRKREELLRRQHEEEQEESNVAKRRAIMTSNQTSEQPQILQATAMLQPVQEYLSNLITDPVVKNLYLDEGPIKPEYRAEAGRHIKVLTGIEEHRKKKQDAKDKLDGEMKEYLRLKAEGKWVDPRKLRGAPPEGWNP
ncbi:MAG: hypothetical protein M1834_008705 [Cirrosporium novae-zelandiae]|nr:MAG: hypothetical protein M1834_008705 [Cirrosporium novae-zelandiae]